MASFLVTGSAGFVGHSIVKTLLENGHDVVGIDNFSVGKRQVQHPRFQCIQGDILDLSLCHHAVKGMDYVIHQAALTSVPESLKDPLRYHDHNVLGTLNMLLASRAASIQRFVLASSSAVYGHAKVLPIKEDSPICPLSPYGTSKVMAEYYVSLFYRCYGLPGVILRYFNIFGPGQDAQSYYASVIPKFIQKLQKNQAIDIFGDGHQTRDFVYVDTVVHANIQSCLAPLSDAEFAKPMNIGSGIPCSLNHLKTQLSHYFPSLKAHYLPEREGDICHSVADIARMNTVFKLPPIHFEEGLKHMVNA